MPTPAPSISLSLITKTGGSFFALAQIFCPCFDWVLSPFSDGS